jgi:hypothetical protein
VKNAGAYSKSLIPLLITALYSIQSALSDGRVTNTEWAGIATGLLASLGAFIVPNTKPPVVAPAPVVTVSQPQNQNAAAPVTTVTEPVPPTI